MPEPLNCHQPFLLPANRVWRSYTGGILLDRLEKKAEPADGHFPEDWVGSTTRAINFGREHLAREGLAVVRTAAGRLVPLDELIAASPEEMLGPAHVEAFGAQPQLLVKLLDSAVRLHIQAHPSVPWAKAHLGSASGKTEAWWILAARNPADAWVLLGFQRPPTLEAWRRMLLEQDRAGMLSCFDRIPVAPGDVILVEGGVPHAIGPGLLMVEVQEPTDYVVRCEWALGDVKADVTAQTMGLGVEGVLDMFDYRLTPAEEVRTRYGPQPTILTQTSAGREVQLLAQPQTDRLELRRLEVCGCEALPLESDGRFSILIVLAGAGRLTAEGCSSPLEPWSRVFLPAALRGVKLEGTMTVARALPPLAEGS
jgi:mannose-6-phosphate isomerase